VYHLRASIQHWSHISHRFAAEGNRLGVIPDQRGGRAGPQQSRTAGGSNAALHEQQIRAERFQLVLRLQLGASTDGDHGDHRGDADDHPQHGEDGTQPIGQQRLPGQGQGFGKVGDRPMGAAAQRCGVLCHGCLVNEFPCRPPAMAGRGRRPALACRLGCAAPGR